MNDAPKRRSRVQQEQPVERTGSRHRSRRSRGGRSSGPMKGANLRTSIRITFEEAVFLSLIHI